MTDQRQNNQPSLDEMRLSGDDLKKYIPFLRPDSNFTGDQKDDMLRTALTEISARILKIDELGNALLQREIDREKDAAFWKKIGKYTGNFMFAAIIAMLGALGTIFANMISAIWNHRPPSP